MNVIPATRQSQLELQRCANPLSVQESPLVLKALPRNAAVGLCLLVLFLLTPSGGMADSTKRKAHPPVSPNDPATVLRVKLLLKKDSSIMEITSSRPLRPGISRIQDPPALRIDLNNARVSGRHKEFVVKSPLIGGFHIDQLARTPPLVTIVVNELKPLSYTWDAAGNRLTIRLHMESEEVTAKPPSVTALGHNTEAVAVPVNRPGRLIFADQLASGTSFSAGFDTETLRLSRGGEVHVCPRTTVSVVHPQNAPGLMLAMGVGAIETHYALDNSMDTIVTPDFRIVLRGPGEFHYAIRADSRGNTCVRALPGNTAPVMVFESMGNGQFEVVPSERLIFHAGQMSTTDTAFHSGQLEQVETVVPDDCGCPAPLPLLRAELPASPVLAADNPSTVALTQPPVDASGSTKTEAFPVKPIQFSANLVFSPEDAPPRMLVDLPLSTRRLAFPDPSVSPPALAQTLNKKSPKGVFRKAAGFFSRVFR
jgi:hypothetical protein